MPNLEELTQQIRGCQRCDLHKGTTQAVPGEGPANAKIMFIGEGPGYHEDKLGRPFVGAAGKFLDELLASIDLRRDDVFITNVVKHRPPQNRDPEPVEIEACRAWLDTQLQIIKPLVVVTLGRFSMERFFPGTSISRVHGQERRVDEVLAFPMFHPAAALHQPRYRTMILEDFQKLAALLQRLEQADAKKHGRDDTPPAEQAQQLSLF